MFYYIPEWIKWWNKRPHKPIPEPEVDALSEIIKKRALEQKSIIDRQDVKKDIELLPNPNE